MRTGSNKWGRTDSNKGIRFVLAILCLISAGELSAQVIDNEFQIRTSTEFSKKIIKHVKLEVTPELRWGNGQFLDEFMLNTGIKYKPLDFLSVSAQYRIIGNIRDEKETEYLGRYDFNIQLSDRIQRWEPGIKLAFTNYTDDTEDGTYLRYKAFLGYDIPSCKLTPEAGFEIYHDLTAANIYKYRTSVGLDYKFSDRLILTCGYKFNYYMTKSKNRHVMEVGLKVKL